MSKSISNSWNDFEHSVWKSLKIAELEPRNSFFLCVSGGLDSMVLLHLMMRIKPQAHFTVAYFHHGLSDSEVQYNFREACFSLIKKRCLEIDSTGQRVQFISERSQLLLKSEAEFRNARWEFFARHKAIDQIIMTAHHLDDWAETLTLKLIRGVGAEGFTALKMWDKLIFRPFLETQKKELLTYGKLHNLEWLEDPSNDSDHYLRNWLRLEWFKSLDEKNPSGYDNYSRSLLRLCQELQQNQTFELCFYSNNAQMGLDRIWYFSLSEKHQMKAIALYLRNHHILNTTQGQIAEIQKRLSNDLKDNSFSLGAIKWLINARQIMVQF